MSPKDFISFFEEESKQTQSTFLFFLPIFIFFCFTLLWMALLASIFLFFLMGALPFQNLWGAVVLLVLSFLGALSFWYYLFSYGFLELLYLLEAKAIDPQDRYHHMYENIVEEISVSAGLLGKITPLVIPTKAINGASISSRTSHFICITEGAISKLSRAQLQALVAHSVAKIALQESKFSTLGSSMLYFFYKLRYFWPTKLLLYPVIHLIFSLLSRSDIYRCDAAAVRLTRDPQSLGEALYLGEKSFEKAKEYHPVLSPLFVIPPHQELFFPSLSSRLKKLQKMGAQTSPEKLEQLCSAQNLKPQVEENQEDEEEKRKWMVLREEETWEGPFSAKELFSQSWFHPEIWVRLEREEFQAPAYAHPEMYPFFQGKLPTSHIKCPNCGAMFIQKKVVGLNILQCLHCKGILIPDSYLLPLITRKAQISPPESISFSIPKSWEEAKTDVEYRKPGRVCPYCRDLMRNFPYSLAYPIALDKCETCGRIWLDPGELEMIEKLVEANKIGDRMAEGKSKGERSKVEKSFHVKENFFQGVSFLAMGMAYLIVFSPLLLPFGNLLSWQGCIIAGLFLFLVGGGVGLFLSSSYFSSQNLLGSAMSGLCGGLIALALLLPLKITVLWYALFSALFAFWMAHHAYKDKVQFALPFQEWIKLTVGKIFLAFPLFWWLLSLSFILVAVFYPLVHSESFLGYPLFKGLSLLAMGALLGISIHLIFFPEILEKI